MSTLTIATDNDSAALWDGFGRFIPRLSLRDGALLDELREGAVAKPLVQARCDQQMVLVAHNEPTRRVLLEPEAWRNQRPRHERHREFNALGEPSLRGQLDPATLRSARASALVRYCEVFIVAAESRHSDAVLLPSHLAGGFGAADREGELRLAAVGAALARREGYTERGERPKPLFASVTIDAGKIGDARSAVALARSYADLECDAYWVQVARLTETTTPETVALAATFVFALEENSGRRVYAVDCKNLILPFLASRLWGACVGVGEREQFTGPEATSTARRAIKPTVLHRELLRNFQVGSAHALAAFHEFPCDCGVHEPDEAPSSKPDIRRHALRLRLAMTRAATGAGAMEAVRSAVREAGWAAHDLGLEQPPVAAYEAVFEAPDWRSVAAL